MRMTVYLLFLLLVPWNGPALAQAARESPERIRVQPESVRVAPESVRVTPESVQAAPAKPPATATLRPGIAEQVRVPVTAQQRAFQRALGVRGGVSFQALRAQRIRAEEEAARRHGPPPGVVPQNRRNYQRQPADCDDRDSSVHPGQVEVCNFKDDNCDGQVDEGVTWTVWRDADGDGFGDPSQPVQTCPVGEALADVALNNRDCDDTDASRNPTLGTCP